MLNKFMPKAPSGATIADSSTPFYKRKWFIAVVVIVVLAMMGNCSSRNASRSVVDASSGEAEKQVSVELKPTTEYLEYSNKTVDPTSLVKASDAKATVTAQNEIDLTSVGTQTVTYEISLNGSSSEQTVEFTVRDTKEPGIELGSTNPSIEQGGSYDPKSAVSSVADEIDGALTYVESAPEAKGQNAGQEVFYDEGWYTLEGSVDSATPGTYPIKVTASDKHGNVATKEFNVTVKEPPQQEAAPAAATRTYIANTNTGKFHIPSCSSVKQMNEANKLEITATRDEMIANGYDPCGRCKP